MDGSHHRECAPQPAIPHRSVSLTLLLALLAALPADAERSPAVDVPEVPDNIAAHPAPAQPLPFSHNTHLASGLACEMCHSNPQPGRQMTLPPTQTCMSCHNAIAADQPAIVALREYSDSGRPIPWARVYALTPGISWSHGAHLDAGLRCETCHGDVSRAEAVSETKAIRVMATCIGCHRARGVAADCVTCHAWPTDRQLGIE